MKNFEHIIKNILFKLLIYLSKDNHKVEKPVFNKSSKLLFIRLNRIGDALVVTPLFHIIKENLGCQIDILADKKNYFIFENNKFIDNVLTFAKGIGGFLSTLKKINKSDYDAVIDLHDDISTTVSFLIVLSKCKYKIGMNKGNEKIYTHTIKKLNSTEYHIVDRIMEFSKLFNISFLSDDINIEYYPKHQSFNRVNNFLESNFTGEKLLVGVNISAGSNARFWGTDRFKKLVNLIADYNVNVLILTAVNNIAEAQKIAQNKFVIYHTPDFDEFAAMISKLDFLFTPDTSIVHLASAYKIPMFGIYVKYKTSDMIWSPYRSEYEAVITEEPNFKNLSYTEVKNKFQPFFEKIYHGKNNTRL